MKKSDAKRSFLIVGTLAFSSLLMAMDNPFSYENGINDCDVIKYNGEYYITGNWLGGDMFQSRNLTDWGQRQHIYSWNNTWNTAVNGNPDMDIHGTHIAYDNGVFHLYAHLGSGIVHAASDTVTGPYTEPVDSKFDNGIDVNTFKDEDGSLHYYNTRFGGVSGNHNDYRSMSDYSTFSSNTQTLIWPTGGWEINPELSEFTGNPPTINEGPFVFKYRNQYYMLYNANHTGDTSYAIGCTMADTPNSFSNAGKNPDPVLGKTAYNNGTGNYDIFTLGQPWVVDGLNGFEKWAGYFAIDENETYEGRTQRIDRIHFFDRTLYIDGPTNRYTPGYHPEPAEPQLRSLFYLPDGSLPAEDWTQTSPNNSTGQWSIQDLQAQQTSQSCFSFNLVNREPAVHYLFEANVKMTEPQDNEDKAGVVAYYKDANNWVIVGVDRSLGYGADNWYCHVKTDMSDAVVATGAFAGTFDYSVYHKIRIERNGTVFRLWIDDVLPPGFSNIETNITDAGVPGIYANHAPVAYDGIIYTIGWDEYDELTTGWGDGVNDNTQTGSWSVGNDGITAGAGFNVTYKGDPMGEYEFSTHIYKSGTANGVMGTVPVAIDSNNYLKAYFDLVADRFIVAGKQQGNSLSSQMVDVVDKQDYNLRVVKLNNKVIFFVDGQQVLTYNISFGPSQVGLFTENMQARFNGILVYRTESGSLPEQWKNTDVGNVGFAGSAAYNEGTFTINGSGHDIWHLEDGFHFVYQDLYGDGEIIARLVSNDITDWWSKAAIMIRDGLANNAPMAMLNVCGGGNLQFIWRQGPGYGTGIIEAPNSPYAHMIWLKLKRVGADFYAYLSYDGDNWDFIGQSTPGFNSDRLKIGLAVTSHNNSRLNGVVFDNVTINGCTPGDYQTDLSQDCIIDIEDLEIFAEWWLMDVPSGNLADFDNSGKIDLIDFVTLSSNWLAD